MLFLPAHVAAQESAAPSKLESLSAESRMNFARNFLSRMQRGFNKADQSLKSAGRIDANPVSTLPDGEELLFRIRLKDRMVLDTPVYARVENGGLIFSLSDFTTAVGFPIAHNPDTNRFEGWYMREENTFSLDVATHAASIGGKTFKTSSAVKAEGEDVLVPLAELATWFGLTLKSDISKLDLYLESPEPLPIQERLAREKRVSGKGGIGAPELPLLADTRKPIDVPMVDVMTTSRYSRPGDGGDTTHRHTASVRTAGDFLGGTLKTQSLLDDEEKLTNVRATYKQESLEPELLGPMAARKYELGDVNAVNLPLSQFNSLGTGARVTNIHPLRSYLRPETEITGDAFPGWDVELYRNNALVAFQRVGDDGIYRFENVELFLSDNNFRVVMYGPQGERREEEVYIPVDNKRLSETEGAYDISVHRQQESVYQKLQSDDEDQGAPNLSALFEKPVSETTALSAGIESGSREGEQIVVGHAGISTILSDTLLNLSTAVEHTGEMAAELVARRNIGDHQLRSETTVQTEAFSIDAADADGTQEVFAERFSAYGPLGFEIGSHEPQYNLALNYGFDADGNNIYGGSAGVSGSWDQVSLSQQLDYFGSDRLAEDTLNSITTVYGLYGRNRLRFIADYEIQPDSHLDRVIANVNRRLTNDLEMDFTVEHHLDPKLTEARAQLNWWAGYAYLSPGIAYNSDNDLVATLNTRFGLAKDPQNDQLRMFDRNITNNGGVSAFVFLDKNGDNTFGDGDEPLPDVVVRAPQNSGREITGEDGYAFFNRMAHMRMTDVFVDPESLQDPFWISGNPGSSVLPREGHVAALQFPIHMSGEIDGTVYARGHDGNSLPLRGMTVSLYRPDGTKVMSSVSESDGFYLLSKIPPGDYFINVDNVKGVKNHSRPLPKPISIGFEGTTIYGNNIYFEEGSGDVPYAILSDATKITADLAKIEGRRYVLNLGSFGTRVAMGLAWYKMKLVSGSALSGVTLLDRPSESYVDLQSKKHVLRALLPGDSLRDAERRCETLNEKGQTCVVEILPGGLPQQQVQAAPAPPNG